MNSGPPASAQLHLPGGGRPCLTPTQSSTLYTRNTTCEQENLIMDPDPKRLWDSSNLLIQDRHGRWKCAFLTMGLHKQAPPASAAKGAPAGASKAISTPQTPPTSLAMSQGPTVLSSPSSWGLQSPSLAWPHSPCVPEEQGQTHEQLSCSALPCNTLACHHLTPPRTSHCRIIQSPRHLISAHFVSDLFWALGWSLQEDGWCRYCTSKMEESGEALLHQMCSS